MPYSVILVNGVAVNAHRGIGFLQCEDEARIDGQMFFERLKEKIKHDLLGRFDYWLSGSTFDKYFHGWPNNADYKNCFAFKWKQAGANHRLYGFLCHPKPAPKKAFQACIIVLHSQKQDETDYSELDYINRLRVMPEIIGATERAFRD